MGNNDPGNRPSLSSHAEVVAMGKDSARELVIDLGYDPRAHQDYAHRNRPRFFILPWHRRAGKRVWCVMELIDAALRSPGELFGYVAPTRAMAKQSCGNS